MTTKNLQRVLVIQTVVVLVKTHQTIAEVVYAFKRSIAKLTSMVGRLTTEKEFYSISKTFDSYELDHRKSAKQTSQEKTSK